MSERVQRFRAKIKEDAESYQLHLEKERDRDHRRRENLKIKRLMSTTFDDQQRKKERERKRCYRAKLATQQIEDDSSSKRKEIGRKQRAATNKRHQREIEELHAKLNAQRKKIRQLTDKVKQTYVTQDDEQDTTPEKVLWGSLTPRSRKKAKSTMREEAQSTGLNFMLRRNLGLNISKRSQKEEKNQDMARSVEEFLSQDEISKLCPDTKKVAKNGKQIRYRLHYLSVLHARFVAETGHDCHYSTFTRYVPDHIKKPKASDWGTCLCAICLNPELKLEKLAKLGYLPSMVLDHNFDANAWETLQTKIEKQKELKVSISYVEWGKEKSSPGTTSFSRKLVLVKPMEELAEALLGELEVLRVHLNRIKSQYDAFKAAKILALNDKSTVTMQIDWSENVELEQTRQEHSAYYGQISISIHAGYVWSKELNHGFAALSDCTDHRAPAVWASLMPMLDSLVRDGKKSFNIISDSPSSQYRNKSSFYYAQDFAKSKAVTLKWIFLESGHGKGTADGIGAVVKRLICDTVAYRPDDAIKVAETIYNLIHDQTAIYLLTYNEADVEQFRSRLPLLRPVKGTMKLHEVMATPLGQVYGRNLSTDELREFHIHQICKNPEPMAPEPNVPEDLPEPAIPESFVHSYAVGDYVVIKYTTDSCGLAYLGVIQRKNAENMYDVAFLECRGQPFFVMKENDVDLVGEECIRRKVNEPTISRRGHYIFTDLDGMVLQ